MREEVAMDVDEDENATQQAKRVPDYDIEVDFSSLEEDELEVRLPRALRCSTFDAAVCDRAVQRLLPS